MNKDNGHIHGGKGTTAKASRADCVAATGIWAGFVPRPLKVFAVKMRDPFTVNTLNGPVQGKAGEYLVQGIQGELYPCAADIFEKKYKAVE